MPKDTRARRATQDKTAARKELFEVEWAPLTSIKPYGKNPRTISEKAVAKVAASLREFGWRQPIVVDAKMTVIAGHTRLMAAASMGLSEVPVHVAANLTAAQARAYRLADNRVAQESHWDDDLAGSELADLFGAGFDMSVIGFEDAEWKRLAGLGVEAATGFSVPSGDKEPFEQMTFTLHTSQADTVRAAIALAKKGERLAIDSPNENSNGNALALIAEMALANLS